MKDSEVVDAFVAHLAANGYPGLRVESRPDEQNRTTSDIDAVAPPFAIEHTSLDTLPEQRRRSEWFDRVVGGLERELQGALPFRLSITFSYDAISSGLDWSDARSRLRDWIVTASPALPEGFSGEQRIAGIPVPLHVKRETARNPRVVFSRICPKDLTLPLRTRALLERKGAKLQPYKASGLRTVLLVESADLALMNASLMTDAINAAFDESSLSGTDEIWYVDTSLPSALEFWNLTTEIATLCSSNSAWSSPA